MPGSLGTCLLTFALAAEATGDGSLPTIVRGTVLRPDGLPFPGFTVRVEEYESRSRWTARPAAVTGPDGRFCIELEPSQRPVFVYGVGPDGLTRLPLQWLGEKPRAQHEIAPRRVEPVDVWLTGVAVDLRSVGVAGATVAVESSGSHQLTTTDESGRFLVFGIGARESCDLQARLGDLLSRVVRVESDGRSTREVELVLGPTQDIRGVVRTIHGDALSGVWVHAALAPARDEIRSSTWSGVSTAAEGAFAFDPFPVGRTTLSIDAGGFERQEVVVGEPPTPVEVVLDSDLEVRGTALDDEAKPVRIVDAAGDSSVVDDLRLQGSEDGEFRLFLDRRAVRTPSGGAGPTEVWLRAAGFAPARLSVSDDASTLGKIVRFDAGRALDVLVLDHAGLPVVGARIEIRFALASGVWFGEPLAEIVTTAGGRARAERLPDAPLAVRVDAENQPSLRIDDVDVATLAESELRVELPVAGFIAGQVTDRGRPLGDCDRWLGSYVEVWSSPIGGFHIPLDAAGFFHAGPLPPGEYFVDCCGSVLMYDCEIWLEGERVAEPADSIDYGVVVSSGNTRRLEIRIVR